MIRSRFSLLGVLVVAIGLMAFFASAAQAEGEWLVLKADGKLYSGAEIEANAEKFEILELENKTGALLSEIGTTKIAILCTALELIDALLNATGGIKEGAKVKFTGCKFLAEGPEGLNKEFPKCVPKTNGGPNGTVETLPFHGLLKLHELKLTGEKHDTLLLLPDDKIEEHVTTLELGAACAFGEEIPIFGLLSVWSCAKEPNKEALEHLLSHLITEFEPLTTLSLFALRGKLGAKNAKIDGSARVRLFSDRLWAGSPK